MKAKLTQLSKSAMQSGRAKTGVWLLEFTPDTAMPIDPLMGWSGMDDTKREVKLRFDTQEAALSYAKENALEISLQPPAPRRQKVKAYADNFKFDKKAG